MGKLLLLAIITFLSAMLAKNTTLYYLSYFFTLLSLLLFSYHRNLIRNLEIKHKIIEHWIFPGEQSHCLIEFINHGPLPIYWLKVIERFPLQLTTQNRSGVIMLSPGEKKSWNIVLKGSKRGYYQPGPLNWECGDLLGFKEYSGLIEKSSFLIVYPRILALERLGLPSRLPYGETSWPRPLYQDPVRMIGIREYIPGDRLNRIHWKATAHTGKLQVREFESTVTVETEIILNMGRGDYGLDRLGARTELAVTAAASIAFYLTEKKQSFGLITNGVDPLSPEKKDFLFLNQGQGRGHLQEVLELLARLGINEDEDACFSSIFNQQLQLAWGSTLILITAEDSPDLIEQALSLVRRGYMIKILISGEMIIHRQYRNLPLSTPLSIYQLTKEEELYSL